jgi:hypothetical protein
MSDESGGRSTRGDVLPFPNIHQEPAPALAERELLGEVISASYSQFCVESYDIHQTPPLGSLVVVQDVIGIVGDARTEGLGPVSAKGTRDDVEGDVYRIHPELSRTLRTQFTALVVGHYAYTREPNVAPEARRVIYTYPDMPPRLHYKAYRCSSVELLRFTEKPNYLRLLLQSEEMPVDEVIIHLLAHAFDARNGDRAHLLQTTEYLGRLLKGQYDRLVAILETLGTLIGDEDV